MVLESNAVQASQKNLPGRILVDSVLLSDKRQDLLFAALFMTTFGVWLGGNLLLLSFEVLAYSSPVGIISLGLLFIFYALSRLLKSIPWGLLITCISLVFLVYAKNAMLSIALYLACLLAFLYAVVYFRVDVKCWLSAVSMAIIGTATILGVGGYTYFDIVARLQSGMIHQDVLFHSSIAAMIKNYGIVSTGLHGLVETPYHALSHVMIAGVSLTAGVGVLETYGVAPLVLFAPLLIFAVTVVIVMIDRRENLSLPMLWGTTAFCLFAFPLLFSGWALWDSFFVSESYMLSLVFFLLGFGFLFKQKLSMVDLVTIVFFAALIAQSKASVGLIFVGLLMVRVIFLQSQSRNIDLLTAIFSIAIVVWSVVGSAGAVSEHIPIIPLSFVTDHSLWGGQLSAAVDAWGDGRSPSFQIFVLAFFSLFGFIAVHFLVSWIVVFVNYKSLAMGSIFRTPVLAYSVASVGAGIIIVLMFFIPGGSAYYFTNVSFFVSLPFFVVILVNFFQNKGFHERLLFVIAIIIISLMSLRVYYNRSILSSLNENNPLVSHLMEVRKISSLNQVFQPSNTFFDDNPIKRCSARPFIFAAVSERAWVDVVQGDGLCDFKYYGYSQYGLAAGDQRIKVPPVLRSDMFTTPEFFKP